MEEAVKALAASNQILREQIAKLEAQVEHERNNASMLYAMLMKVHPDPMVIASMLHQQSGLKEKTNLNT